MATVRRSPRDVHGCPSRRARRTPLTRSAMTERSTPEYSTASNRRSEVRSRDDIIYGIKGE